MARTPRRKQARPPNSGKAAKVDLARLLPDEAKYEIIPTASAELDATLEAIAEATNAILDSAEAIDEIGGELGGDRKQDLLHATAAIYEACGFQDITGQRISKVVKTLKKIEDKVDDLIAASGGEGPKKVNKRTNSKSPKKPLTDEYLLEGQQLKGVGKSQAEVDALLAEFE